jgi:hypothetical protein
MQTILIKIKYTQNGASSSYTFLIANKNHSHLDHCMYDHDGKP